MDCHTVSPETLLEAQSGNRDAFRRIVETCHERVFAMAMRMTRNRADAEDLTQEVFLRLYRGLGSYDPGLPFDPWLRRVASNTALNFLKMRKRLPDAADLEAVAVARNGGETQSDDERLRRLIGRLSEEQRVAITMKYYDNASVEEIAAALGAPAGTVKIWLFRARNTLKDLMGEKR